MAPSATQSLVVLGSFVLRIDGREVAGLPRKAQALVAFLALQPDHRIAREVMADLLWTEHGTEQARHSLRQLLLVLRRTPAAGLIRTDAADLWVELGGIGVDALEFQAGAATTDPDALARCAALYRGPLLQNLPSISPRFDEWLRAERGRLAGIMAALLHRLAVAYTRLEVFDAAIATATRLVGMDELNEAAQRLLIETLARAGRRTEALQQFERSAAVLRRELDVAPEPETVALVAQIRAGTLGPQRGALARPTSPPPPGVAQRPASEPIPLAAPLAALTDPAPGNRAARALPALRRPMVRTAWIAALLGIIALLGTVYAIRPRLAASHSLAVLPFRDASDRPAEAGAIAGFTDVLETDLAERYHVRLTPTAAAFTEDSTTPPELAARYPSTRYLLEGTASFAANTFHVTVRLKDLRGGRERWSASYAVPAAEALRVTDDIALRAAHALAKDPSVAAAVPAAPIADRPALVADLLALGQAINTYFAADANLAARQVYLLASRQDPNNAEVLARLANTYIVDGAQNWPDGETALNAAEPILKRALVVDPANVVALFNLGLLRRIQGRHAEAIELCKRVLQLWPHYPGALREIGHDLLETGHAQEAITWYQDLIDVAPALPFVHDAYKGLGVAAMALGDRARAVRYLTQAVTLDTSHVGDAELWLTAALEMSGQHAEAAARMAEFRRLHPQWGIASEPAVLLEAPAYAAVRHDVLAAFADAWGSR